MKRRSFLQSVLGFLGLPFVPETKAKTLITDSKPLVGEFGTIGGVRWLGPQGIQGKSGETGPKGGPGDIGQTPVSNLERLKEEFEAIFKEWKEAIENYEKA